MAGKGTLLVEGPDDEHVLKHLCRNRGIGELDEIGIRIERHGGITQLLKSLPVRLELGEEGSIIGVVIDADTDLASRWRSLRDRLIRLEYENVPENPAPDGTILDPPADKLLPRLGIWIMPDNQTTGILEDFLRFLVPEESRLFERVESCVTSIPQDECRFSELARPKAVIHTWLAWQEEPGKPLGLAITEKYLDPHVPQVDVLVSWLNRLFFA